MLGKTNASGGAALLVRVVGGTTQPASPRDKTVWVNTATAIPGWAFSTEQPESPAEGTVWFKTGAASSVAFSATEHNPIMVYPVQARQYISGAWASVTAKSYLNGVWTDWSLPLYTPGDTHSNVTGGFEAKALKCASDYGGNTLYANAPTVSQGTESMAVSLSNQSAGYNRSGSVLTANKIDLTGYSSLTFRFSKSFGNNSNYGTFYVSQSNSQSPVQAAVSEQVLGSASATSVTLDVSALAGEYYVGVNLLAGAGSVVVTSTVNITEIMLS